MLTSIEETRLLLVEGPDDRVLVQAVLDHLNETQVQVHEVGGKTNFRPVLQAVANTPGFSNLAALGVIRDANSSADDALRSVQDALASASLPVPRKVLQPQGSEPKVVILLVPHGETSGQLEDLCLTSVADDAAMPCVEAFIECVMDGGPKDSSKARVQAFLASRDTPGKRLGEAAMAGYWALDHSAFDSFRQLLSML